MGGRIFYTGDVKEFKLYSKQDVERVVSNVFLLTASVVPHGDYAPRRSNGTRSPINRELSMMVKIDNSSIAGYGRIYTRQCSIVRLGHYNYLQVAGRLIGSLTRREISTNQRQQAS